MKITGEVPKEAKYRPKYFAELKEYNKKKQEEMVRDHKRELSQKVKYYIPKAKKQAGMSCSVAFSLTEEQWNRIFGNKKEDKQ